MKNQVVELRTSFSALSRSLDEQYIQLKSDLDKWHSNMFQRVQDMYLDALIELDTSYERLDTFRQTLYVLLDDERLTGACIRWPVARTRHRSCSLVPMTSADINAYSTRLSWLESEIDSILNLFFRINCPSAQLNHRPYLVHANTSSVIPCRILIRREHVHLLPDSMNDTLFTLVAHPSSPEAVLITSNVQQLSSIVEDILSHTNELRVLVHECYAPFIIGQLGSRAKALKDKYALTNLKVYPTCAPLSTERILLLTAAKYEQIIDCLAEIYLNMCQTSLVVHNQQATFLYSPEFYDVSLADDYGGFVDRHNQSSLPRSATASSGFNNMHDDDDDDDLSGYEDEDVEDFDHDGSSHATDSGEPLRERHWTLSDAQAGALFGPSSSRLHQIRSESNAWIVIYEADGKGARRPMSIRGTKAEIEHATKLILETIKRHDRKLPVRHSHKRGK